MGSAGEELLFMVPGDRIQLETGQIAYVNADGYLIGINNIRIPAAGRKMRDVIEKLSVWIYFDKYRVIEYGDRTVEVLGAVRFPGKYELPQEGWSLMNLLMKVESLLSKGEREFLVIRASWELPGKFIFIRGLSLPTLEGMGGDDLPIFAQDTVIFPGSRNPVYVFGAVKSPVCFSYSKNSPTLKTAIDKAGGFLRSSDIKDIRVFRILRSEKQSVFKIPDYQGENFELEPWDIVYVPSRLPSEALEEQEKPTPSFDNEVFSN